MRKKQIPYPKRKARLSLQFYYDDTGLINFLVTVQKGKLLDSCCDMHLFGYQLANNDNSLTIEEKIALKDFCEAYIKRFEELRRQNNEKRNY